MLNYEQILELMNKLEESDLNEISIAQGDFALELKKPQPEKEIISAGMPMMQMPQAPAPQPQAAPTPAPIGDTPAPASSSNLIEVKSPMVGTFYAAPSPDSPDFATVGQSVKAGDTLCIIEAMKVMNEFPSDVAGTIEEICVNNAETVEFGQVIFKIKPA